MKPRDTRCDSKACDYWMVSQAASRLGNQATTLGARHINDGTLRLQFTREISYYARVIVNDVAQGNKSPEQGLNDIKNEQNDLLSQSMKIAQQGIGAIAGALQFGAGAGLCYASVGTLCLFIGAPLMAHGANNTYENGRNLWVGRSDTQGPLRKGYQTAARFLGGTDVEGDMAYAAVDLSSSAYGVGKMVLKPDAWRLFRYARADYVRSYETMSKSALSFEVLSNSTTLNALYQEIRNKDD